MFDPILPKRKLIDTAGIGKRLSNTLRAYGLDTRRTCADYEVPTTFRLVPYRRRMRSAKTGRLVKRRGMREIGYKRTNILKGSWSVQGPHVKGGTLEVIVVSSGSYFEGKGVAPYNIFVRGPKKGKRHQSARMAARGWRSVTDIKKDEWPDTLRKITKIVRGR